jgi:sugar phosphate isomerase/epimerase
VTEQRIALQLYTLREQMARDASGALQETAAAGYKAVELVGYGNLGLHELRGQLESLGLQAFSAHIPFVQLEQELDRVVKELQLLGCIYVVIQDAPRESWSSEDAVHRLADLFNQWGRRFRDGGLYLGYHGYHNLDVEFARHGERTMFDLLAEGTRPDLLHIQLDTYWIHRLGANPVELLKQHAGRVPTLHLKDVVLGGEDAPLGEGLVPWREVIEAARAAGTEWLIVEQEGDPENAFRDIRHSLQNLGRLVTPTG